MLYRVRGKTSPSALLKLVFELVISRGSRIKYFFYLHPRLKELIVSSYSCLSGLFFFSASGLGIAFEIEVSVTAHPEMDYCSRSFRFNHVLNWQLGSLHMHLILLNKIMAEPKSENPGLLYCCH